MSLTIALALAACGSDDSPDANTPAAQAKKSTQLFTQTIAPYTNWGNVPIVGTGYGSAFTAAPNQPGFFYGMTDRGPNVTAPDGSNKIEPYLEFQPAIALFQLASGKANVSRVIGLSLADGTPINGKVNPEASTAEKIYDVNGNVLPTSTAGLDPEGLVALADGTFWVSDEYGPYIVHFDANGKEISRLNPYSTATTGNNLPLPGELKKRNPNRGMEGLTIMPDGKYLVGIMQSPLDKNGTTATAAGKGAVTRVVKISLADPVNDAHEYLYSLHTNGAGNPEGQAVSEIAAMPDGTFIVDERDGNFEGTATGKANADKNLWKLDLSAATDVGPKSPLIGTTIAGGVVTYDSTNGLKIGGKTIEDIAGTADSPAAVQALATAGITVGARRLVPQLRQALHDNRSQGHVFRSRQGRRHCDRSCRSDQDLHLERFGLRYHR
ncbi:esterase-like activity of phytase family protein [Candidatus Burkholderia verschuerenii]|uniref:esterase-like activity of phytase family protein n=1 Tax=Candidatus Burkholderia verschuerenii TaxID=242163 RepID=UPI0018DE309D|nr:esterase-like activity of phytase family protein [Candidatus Burkholderia verschuerenii]